MQLAAMAGLLGRALLVSPPLFSAVVTDVSSACALPNAHVHFASRWLQLSDSMLLSVHRKLAALALATLLPLDAASLPLVGEILSFCVGVLEELEPMGDGGPVLRAVSVGGGLSRGFALGAGEHADFTGRMAEAGLDPVPDLELRPALKQLIASCQSAHGDAFDAQVRALDADLMAQVRRVFGAV
jgi:hypothetical protein